MLVSLHRGLGHGNVTGVKQEKILLLRIGVSLAGTDKERRGNNPTPRWPPAYSGEVCEVGELGCRCPPAYSVLWPDECSFPLSLSPLCFFFKIMGRF